MNSVRARVAYVVTLSLVTLAASAAPAAAAPASRVRRCSPTSSSSGSTGSASCSRRASVLWLLATLVGYYLRVIRPKHRGRETS